MASITIEIKSNRLGEIARRIPGASAAIIRKTVTDLEAQAKQRAPVDTGALRNSIQGRVINQYGGEVTVGAEYGIYVEMGTRHAPAQPFLHPAADVVRPEFEAAVAKLAEGL